MRQGCPLSPLLFLIAIEPLLEELSTSLPDCTFRAYADDIGGVLKDIATQLPVVIGKFSEFGSFSGLGINMGKTIAIPARRDINPRVIEEYKAIIQATAWPQVVVKRTGKYLGFMLGTGSCIKDAYNVILEKMDTRLRQWQGQSFGLFEKNHVLEYFCDVHDRVC